MILGLTIHFKQVPGATWSACGERVAAKQAPGIEHVTCRRCLRTQAGVRAQHEHARAARAEPQATDQTDLFTKE